MSKSIKCTFEECIKPAQWEVGFSIMVIDDYTYECSGENEFQEFFCDKHFIKLSGCGNTVEFREIGTDEWINFDDSDSIFILKNLVREKNFRKKFKQKKLEMWI